mmetsp:Transcript_146789/g.471262  ORF Transcript_146789/g.471262 Transcript_146789/m.471262 type:complete len:361 (-) Transcript_146789:561-1643(-)
MQQRHLPRELGVHWALVGSEAAVLLIDSLEHRAGVGVVKACLDLLRGRAHQEGMVHQRLQLLDGAEDGPRHLDVVGQHRLGDFRIQKSMIDPPLEICGLDEDVVDLLRRQEPRIEAVGAAQDELPCDGREVLQLILAPLAVLRRGRGLPAAQDRVRVVALEGAEVSEHAGVGHTDQCEELVQVVLDGSSRNEQSLLGLQAHDTLRHRRLVVFELVRFVADDKIDAASQHLIRVPPERLVGCYEDLVLVAALECHQRAPHCCSARHCQSNVLTPAVQPLLKFGSPILDQGCRTNNDRLTASRLPPGTTLCQQSPHDRNGLQRLAQAHVVCQDAPEALVVAQAHQAIEQELQAHALMLAQDP